MSFATMAAVNAAMPGQTIYFGKTPGTYAPNVLYSSWGWTGEPGAGADPSSGVTGNVPTKATAGALPLVVPSGANVLSLARAFVNYSASSTGFCGMMFLYDRLWHNSGISSTLTIGQAIASVALTRPDANGRNAEAWWQVYATMGAGTPTVTLVYTDQDGNVTQTGTTSALTTAMAVGRTGPFQLASGDTGVRVITTWTASATFTSGTIGLVIRRLICAIPLVSYAAHSTFDALSTALPRINGDACLEFISQATSAGLGQYGGNLHIIEGP